MSWNINIKASTKGQAKDAVAENAAVKLYKSCPPVVVAVLNAAIDSLPDSESKDVFLTTHGHVILDADGNIVDGSGMPNYTLSVQLITRQ
jgi:hypothetical protein